MHAFQLIVGLLFLAQVMNQDEQHSLTQERYIVMTKTFYGKLNASRPTKDHNVSVNAHPVCEMVDAHTNNKGLVVNAHTIYKIVDLCPIQFRPTGKFYLRLNWRPF